MKIASNVGAVKEATSGIHKVNSGKGTHFSLSSSNIIGMKKGAEVGNQLMASMNTLIAGTKKQADKINKLASLIESRDAQDAHSLGK